MPTIIDPSCAPPLKSRQFEFGDEIAFFTFRNQGHIGGFQFDVLCQIPILANSFFLINCTAPANTLYFHLKPTNLSNVSGSAGYNPRGDEQWFPMNVLSFSTTVLGGVNYASFLRFKTPINQFFISLGTESGAGANLTIACVANDAMIVNGGPWT